MQIFFFLNGDLKYFQVGNHTPIPSNFDGLPYPRVGGTPGFFFHQNDRKGCKRDNLDARDHFVLRFGAISDKPLGGGNHPLRKTRVKNNAHAGWVTKIDPFLVFSLSCMAWYTWSFKNTLIY